MYLENLNLVNFKNYQWLDLALEPDINCIVGENGSGKTNLLDAIHYLSMTKSAFNAVDQQSISHGEEFFTIKGTFQKDSKKNMVQCTLQQGQKKFMKVNGAVSEKMRDHIGEFPVVLIAPNDTDLIREGSETRRKYFDSLLSQLNRDYLYQLVDYYSAMRQRNALLKRFQEKNFFEKDLLEGYDNIMLEKGRKLHHYRASFTLNFKPLLNKNYKIISGGKESIDISYKSDFEAPDFQLRFKGCLEKDLKLQRSTFGTHTDDFVFSINGRPLKKYGSQGQQKSMIVALKLAHYETMKMEKSIRPILLLDDIFDKLDEPRMRHLLSMVSEKSFGQILITDARPERTLTLVKNLEAKIGVFEIDRGSLRNRNTL